MNNMWNERYSKSAYAYGEQPNEFLKEQLSKLPVGTILFPADGEGRNSVFAAKLGWKSFAFDQSEEGQKKALQLAQKHQVKIDYQVSGVESISYQQHQFDAIALIYAHFTEDKKSAYHQRISGYLKPGGYLIFEGFSKNHIAYKKENERVGGPGDLGMLFSVDEIKSDFPDFEMLELKEQVIELSEGNFHQGRGSVIRVIARKKSLE